MKESELKTALVTEALIVTVILLVGFGPFVVGWEVFSWEYWGAEAQPATTRSEVVRNFGLLVAAFFGLGFGVWRAYTAHLQAEASRKQAEAANELAMAANQQARITEQGQITDRYTKAVEMLADEKARTRLGAVYALARIAQDSIHRHHISVMEVLTEFIRNTPYSKEADKRAQARQDALEADDSQGDLPPEIPCPDVLAALKVIVERNDAQRACENDANFDLTLFRAALSEHSLGGAKFNDLNLIGANFENAQLAIADFSGARLSVANFSGANLHLAKFINANLTAASFTDVNIKGTEFGGAILSNVEDLEQSKIERCTPSAPPHDLPSDLTWPFVEEDGEWVKRE